MANKEFDYKLLGQRVQSARNKAHLTQSDVASKVGYVDKYISKVETGVSKPSLDLLTKLCFVLDVSMDELVRDSQYVSKKVLNTRAAELFNQLSDTNQKMAIAYLESMLNIQEANKEDKP